MGTLTLAYEVLQISEGQRMSIYQAAPGSPEHDALRRLAVLDEFPIDYSVG